MDIIPAQQHVGEAGSHAAPMAWRQWEATRNLRRKARQEARSGPQTLCPSARRQGRASAISCPKIGRTAFRRFGFVQSSVVTRWPEIVGPSHARVCSPEAIRFPPGEKADGILQLVVLPAHAPLIQQVIPEIIERVNRFFGYKAVARVKLRQGAVKPPARSPLPKPPPSLKPIPLELGDSLRDIGDPELRTVLESLARSLETKETRQEGTRRRMIKPRILLSLSLPLLGLARHWPKRPLPASAGSCQSGQQLLSPVRQKATGKPTLPAPNAAS
jgi:hypothetical protein